MQVIVIAIIVLLSVIGKADEPLVKCGDSLKTLRKKIHIDKTFTCYELDRFGNRDNTGEVFIKSGVVMIKLRHDAAIEQCHIKDYNRCECNYGKEVSLCE